MNTEQEGDFSEADEAIESVLNIEGKLSDFKENQAEIILSKGEKLKFPNVEGVIKKIALLFKNGEELDDDIAAEVSDFTLYNISKRLEIEGESYIIVRGESLKREDQSAILFFKIKEDGVCELDESAPITPGQDPFYCGKFGTRHIFGEVAVYKEAAKPSERQDDQLSYRTVFYDFEKSVNELNNPESNKPFAIGPEKMKDIRLISLDNDRIGVFLRPQGLVGGRGKIGYFEIHDISELQGLFDQIDVASHSQDMGEKNNSTEFLKSTLIEGLCLDEEWVGANDLYLLKDQSGKMKIGVLGHIANMVPDSEGRPDPSDPNKVLGIKNYYAMAFVFDPETKEKSEMKIIATAENFEEVKSKKEDLGSITFSGGLDFNEDNSAWLYVGIGDTEAGRVLVKNPFEGYEIVR